MAYVASLRSAAICARNRPLAQFPATLPRKNLNLQATTQPAGLKCKDDLPGPSFYKIINWLFVKGYSHKLHLLQVGFFFFFFFLHVFHSRFVKIHRNLKKQTYKKVFLDLFQISKIHFKVESSLK